MEIFLSTSPPNFSQQTQKFFPSTFIWLDFLRLTIYDKTWHFVDHDSRLRSPSKRLMSISSTTSFFLQLLFREKDFFSSQLTQLPVFHFYIFLGWEIFIYLITTPGFLPQVSLSMLEDFSPQAFYIFGFSPQSLTKLADFSPK